MDMKDDNDKMLQQFFSPVAEQHMADNGFSQSVMNRIDALDDRRIVWLSRIWTVVCSIAGVVLLLLSGVLSGVQQVGNTEVLGFINSALMLVMSFFRHISTLNVSDIPATMYLLPLAVTVVFAFLAIRNESIEIRN